VPEIRSRPGSRTIELSFVRLRSTAAEPGPPLFFLPGGPGNAAVPLARSPHWARFLEMGDVVLLDPRGVGRSEADLTWSSDMIRPGLLFGDRETAVAHVTEIARAAAADLRAEGIDLDGYTTVECAADVDALRRALGADRMRLLGHSYGTHLGQEIVRRHGAHVDRFVSIGTAGMNDMQKLPAELDASFARVAALVASDETVGPDMPDLVAATRRVMERLERDPMVVTVTDAAGADVEVAVGRFGLQLILVADLGDTSDLPVFPRLIHSIDRGDPTMLRWFIQKRHRQFSALPVLMFVNRGASGATKERWARIGREARTSVFGRARTLFSPEIDRALGTPDLGDAFRAPVTSDVPTLFVSGTLDAHTPPEQAERVRDGFARSSHVIVENGGHEDILRNREVMGRILAFLAGEEVGDERIPAPQPRFVALEGRVATAGHPSLR
jgi:pimeloyl-ACP methyl ester carboxylesterase